jgi:translocator protein
MNRSRLVALAAFGGATAAAAFLGSIPSRRQRRRPWYALLRKPSWQPPSSAFGPVWSALYATIALSGFATWSAPPSRQRTRALGLWGVQLWANAAWSWLFFGAKSPKAALADLGVLVPSIALYAQQARRVSPGAAWLMAPYFGWTCFATALNTAIVVKNR